MPRKPKLEHEKVPPQQRAEMAHRNGMRGGRPPGSVNVLPLGAVKALGTAGYRVRKDIDARLRQDASDVAGYALDRMVQVVAGTIHSRKGPTILKAATALREEMCEPLVKEVKVGGAISLEDMVTKAAQLAATRK
jgi:hypothetical protein